MNEVNDDKWNNLHIDLLIALAKRLDFPGNIKFSAVSKSWKSATFISEVPLPKAPYLLLAEATRAAPTDDDDSYEEEDDDDDSFNDEDNDDYVIVHGDGDHEVVNDASDQVLYNIDKLDGHVSNTRGMFCLSTAKTYNIELPQAFGKLILGTNKGWLLTLGRDLKINLLHPFSKKQISLPPMLTFRTQYDYDDNFTPESRFHMFIKKVAMSSTIPTSDDNRPLPVVMAIYGEFDILGFARPGDELWVDVNVDSRFFEDITFHQNKFYAVNCDGVFMCEIDNDDKRGARGTKIASVPLKGRLDTRWYLVESSSRHDLLLIARIRKGDPYRSRYTRKYYTSKFFLWKMEQTCSEHDELCNWIPVTNLGNEALFIGKTPSFLVSSSETIKQNCIYFTDDSEFLTSMGGGGHDMGIFSIEHGTIEPHFGGKSIHLFSPPLWYI